MKQRRLRKEKKKLPPDKQEKTLIQAQRNYYILKKFRMDDLFEEQDI